MARKYFVFSAVLGVALAIGLAMPTTSHAQAQCTVAAKFDVAPSSACAVTLSGWTREVKSCVIRASLNNRTVTRTPSSGSPSTFTVSRTLASYDDTGLTPGETYSYTAKGLTVNSLTSVKSTPVSVVTPALPSAPSVSTIGANESGGNMKVSFDGSKALSAYGGYTLTRVAGYTGAAQTLYSGVATPLFGSTFVYSDNSYNPLTVNTYEAKFFETDSGCNANTKNVSTSATVTVPGIVTNLVATAATTSVSLSWTNGMGQTYADIYKKTGTGAWGLLTTVTTNTYKDTSVAPGASYTYKVMAVAKISGNTGYAGFSADALAAVPATPIPVPTLNFAARVVYIGTSTADINFTWNNIHPGFAYKVELATSSAPSGYRTMVNAGGLAATTTPMNATAYGVPVGGLNQFRVLTEGVKDVSPLVTVDLSYKALVKGTAWSSTTGWVSLSCETQGTDCTSNRYSVAIGTDNELRGVAWSQGSGWLSFNKADLAGCPDGAANPNNCVAKLDKSANPAHVVGWARFLNQSNGAWDGWMSLNSVPASSVALAAPAPASTRIWNAFTSAGSFRSASGLYDKVAATFQMAVNTLQAYAQTPPAAYGLTYTDGTGKVGGQAWGGNVVGWVDFSGVSGAPVVSNVTFKEGAMINPARTGGTWCDDDPYYAINWIYANSGGTTQKQVKVTVYNASSGAPYVMTTGTSYSRYNLFDPISVVGPKKSFYVGVSAYDGNTWSAESLSAPTTTPARYYPLTYFSWSPTPAKTAWPISFTGTSTLDRSGGVAPLSTWSWLWNFPHATSTDSTRPIDTTKPTATVIFDPATASSTDVVTLTVTDAGHACSLSQQVLGGTAAQPKKIRDIKER